MDSQMKKKARLKSCTNSNQDTKTGVDRISSLPDQLLHHILSFSDARLAVQTSVLSKRWKLTWTTLPFLNFASSSKHTDFTSDIKFIDKLLSRRNPDSDVLKLNLFFFHFAPEVRTPLVDKFIDYAITHNVRNLNVDVPGADYLEAIKLSNPNYLYSNTLRELVLKLPFCKFPEKSDCCWHLPALTTLHLIRPVYSKPYKLPISYLVCLPSLRTLLLDGFELPNSISLPALQTFILHAVRFPKNMSEFCRVFQALGNLRSLTLFFWATLRADFVIDCPKLVNLEISYCTNRSGKSIVTSNYGKIKVLAPKIRNFSAVGIFPIKFGVLLLENVSIQLPDGAGVETGAPSEAKLNFYDQVSDMFRALSGANILTLDLKTIEHVKVPHGFEESSMSSYLKWYLLGHSSEGTIVTTLPQKNIISHGEAAFVTAQDMVLDEPFTTQTKVLVGSKKLHKKVCVDTLATGVQEEHMVKNSVVNADRVTHTGVPVEGTGNDRVSSSRMDRSFGLWRGHEVNSEFESLLDIIMNKYPETFEHFTTTNKKLCTVKLNMLCSSVNVFTKISMSQVDTEMILEHRSVFAALQNLGFNVSWLVNRLNYIEQLRFSQPLLPELHAIDAHIDNAKSRLHDLQILIDDAKIELQDLHTIRAEKMQEIQKAFGTMGTNLLVGCIGDDLLYVP
ncbi:uncharacterized protein LOC141687514 isoform X2 [Apium graveolens]|uniref:uncharacterized protein LOC141687514 isoform X2 n=1 Tax=Apium graveolens TaxID=4045 RepID=UPI003D78C2C9